MSRRFTRSSHSLENQYDIFFVHPNLKSTYKSLHLAAASFWNKIPIHIRKVNYSRNIFKKLLKNWLLNSYNDYDTDNDSDDVTDDESENY